SLLSESVNSNVYLFKFNLTNKIHTLSLHDALPIFVDPGPGVGGAAAPRSRLRSGPDQAVQGPRGRRPRGHDRRGHHQPARRPSGDRKSTRLNSSHVKISYAVFCLKKKTKSINKAR